MYNKYALFIVFGLLGAVHAPIDAGKSGPLNEQSLKIPNDALERYLNTHPTKEDKANLRTYFEYYKKANWNFTVTPPRVTLSSAAKNYTDTVRSFANNRATSKKDFLNWITDLTVELSKK